MQIKQNATKAYTFLFCLLALGMPNLNLLMSIGTILLFILWFVNPGLRGGLKLLKKNKVALAFIGLFFIHILWLVNTENFAYAAKDLRIKLPILVLGVVLGSVPISTRQIKLIFLSLSLGIWVATSVAYYNYFKLQGSAFDHREIVAGISHIRLSLLMVVQIAGLIFFWPSIGKGWRLYGILVFLNTLVFFNVLQSATGFAILLAVLIFATAFYLVRTRRFVFLTAVLIAVAGLLIFGYHHAATYYNEYFVAKGEFPKEPTTVIDGLTYSHAMTKPFVENGNYTFAYLAENSMYRGWAARSKVSVNHDPALGGIDPGVLMRYLTAKGYRKDSLGVSMLTDEEIRNIENGFPAPVYAERTGLAMRFHSLLYSYHIFKISGNVEGLSFFQRLVYWKVGMAIVADNFFTGVGTGDIKDAFLEKHEEINSDLDKKYRLRSHNQFITFFATFGILGFIYFAGIFLFAVSRNGSFLALSIVFIAFLSCLTEDTLETQAGVTFFSFFFYLVSKPPEK